MKNIKKTDTVTSQNAEQPLKNTSFPIIGIGASAGGLAAFESFFSNMPMGLHPDCSFVLIQHLSPDHKSILSEIIGRYTIMHVFEAEDGMIVQPNCVYVIPPNHDIALMNGTLQLLEPTQARGQRLPIDFFFRSLAVDLHEHSIGIILSGTGSDGKQGIMAIKKEGGMVMVQNIDSAQFDGMPTSAISTGLVDYELLPEEMAPVLMDYITRSWGTLSPIPIPAILPKHENSLQKIFCLLRDQTGHDFSHYKPSSIDRRITRRMTIHQIDDIEEYVKYLLILPAEIDALFRDLLIGVTNFFRDPKAFEVLEKRVIPKLFEGKTANRAIRVWSCGCSSGEEPYSLAILLQERIEELQIPYLVQIFATDIDTRAIATGRAGLYPISIAADIAPQRLEKFFTLEPDGKHYRIAKKIRDMIIFSEQDVIKDPPFSNLDLISCRNLLIYMGSVLQKKVIPLFHYALNDRGVLFLGTSEGIGEFNNLFSCLDEKSKLYTCNEALKHERRGFINNVIPIIPPVYKGTHVSPKSSIIDNTLPQHNPTGVLVSANGDMLYLYGDANFPLNIGEIPVNTVDGIQLVNEELQSTNEELQSTNEELETSKEEMQSLNEELSTVNAELQTKVIALSQANNDMNNLLSGTGIATLFVDQNLCILRYTPSASLLINLIPSDIGRPVGHITSTLSGYHSLQSDIQTVLETLIPKEIKVYTTTGRWYMMHIIPYRTLENIVKGAVITFVDITEIMKAQESLRHMATIVRDAYDAITVQDLQGNIIAWNRSAVRMYGWSEAEAIMMNIRARIPEEIRANELEKIYQLSHDEILKPYLAQRLCKDGTIKEAWITATALVDDNGKMYAITTTERLNESSDGSIK
ncbi:MAG: PAS domain-containing protein [Campylobacterales bacterium]|nr:PAS domain-containing protein [Campylobacterales bacterium]